MQSSHRTSRRQLARRRGDHGFDEPIWPVLFGLLGVALVIVSWLSFTAFASLVLGLLTLTLGIVSLFNSASYVYTTRLLELGMATEAPRSLGWRFWYGGPWTATRLVKARKSS